MSTTIISIRKMIFQNILIKLTIKEYTLFARKHFYGFEHIKFFNVFIYFSKTAIYLFPSSSPFITKLFSYLFTCDPISLFSSRFEIKLRYTYLVQVRRSIRTTRCHRRWLSKFRSYSAVSNFY